MALKNKNKICLYWDNSNIYISAQQVAEEKEGFNARARVRIHFENLLDLARSERELLSAYAVGSVPPEMRSVWNRLEETGVEVELLERGRQTGSEQGVDGLLQTQMLRNALDYNGDPGIVCLLTGDGKGFAEGVGFHADLKRMYDRGWGIEVLAWEISCARRMRDWAKEVGAFIPLEDFYDQITFLEPSQVMTERGPVQIQGRSATPVQSVLALRETIKQ